MKIMAVLVLMTFFSNHCLAAAAIPAEGKSQLIIKLDRYQSRSEFDQKKDSHRFANSGKFSKNELSFYFLHSLSDKFALVGSGALFNQLTYKEDFFSNKFSGMGDLSIAARYLLVKNDHHATGIQLLGSFPAYTKNSNPTPGQHQQDLELRVLQDFYQVLKLDFFSLEVAYRFRDKAPADELRSDLSFGKSFGEMMLLGQIFYTKSLKRVSTSNTSNNPNNYNFMQQLKLSPSLVYHYNKSAAIQLGSSFEIYGRNFSHGGEGFISWWRDFN